MSKPMGFMGGIASAILPYFIVNLLFVDPPRCTERYHLEQERAFNE